MRTLKASPEKISYSDRDGTRHSSVAYTLSLEIGAKDLRTLVERMTEPVRLLGQSGGTLDLSRGTHYVACESDAERCREIAGEFYPNPEAGTGGFVTSAIGKSERDDQLARICELARKLRFNDAKTRMLLGQWARNLGELEQQLMKQLHEHAGATEQGSSRR